MTNAVLVALPRSIKPEVRKALSFSHHIEELAGFNPRNRGKVGGANLIIAYIDAMSNKKLEDIYALRRPQSVLVLVHGNKSNRKVPLPTDGLLHCVSASEVTEHLARFTS